MRNGEDSNIDQINNELSKAYIGGLLDGVGSITVKVHKADDYAFDFNIEPELTISKSRPHSIKIIGDWTASNAIFGTVNEYDDRFQFRMNRAQDIARFLDLLSPYIVSRQREVELMVEEILPLLYSRTEVLIYPGRIDCVEC